jgi:hypothetical protein
MICLLFFIFCVACLEPFQQAWQASVPIPVVVNFDVPYSSFLQQVRGNVVPIRFHGPEEVTAIVDKEIDAIKYQESTKAELERERETAQMQVLLEAIDRSVKTLVNELVAPLRALPNPLA